MIALALASALIAQEMTQAEMMAEGEEIGRAAAAMGLCSAMGYSIHTDNGERWAEDFGTRAATAGWSEAVLTAAIDLGTDLESAEIQIEPAPDGASGEQLREHVTTVFQRTKRRCRRLAEEHANLISGLDQGDRNADAQLAIMLRPLDQ